MILTMKETVTMIEMIIDDTVLTNGGEVGITIIMITVTTTNTAITTTEGAEVITTGAEVIIRVVVRVIIKQLPYFQYLCIFVCNFDLPVTIAL